ncbi:hypothetical protein GUJ93_ZPchr0009g1149 [Zizania palustris]|uniref:DUF8204 domain-containing protein n=1 Tax=Zizania palustris TaxID=103762 RepID=A0A8J5R3L3_ZIZPA|nr:hypothetical protein GUJ93_ZPchr0009g1149 [Zizania palustris]
MGEESPESGGGAAAGQPSSTELPRKGKSCKGFLYYSSVLRSRGFNPVCVGIPRSIPQVPSYVVDEPREEAAAQELDLTQFKYACAGYSMFAVADKDGQSGEKEGKMLLPYCQGIEVGLHLVITTNVLNVVRRGTTTYPFQLPRQVRRAAR